ncbi:Glycosyltransferase 2, partial [Operophtera brumata]
MHDQPQSGLDRAVWWTEHVLRHGSGKHLRSPSANMPWSEYLELNLVLVFLGLALAFVTIIGIVGFYLCTAQCVWDLVGEQAGCSGPWMTSDLPRCSNYTTMRDLITAYMNTYQSHSCGSCPRFCMSYLYNSFVTDRKTLYVWDSNEKKWCMSSGDAALQTQLYIYFNSMMVSVYEERFNYDWNLFISDLGGSI